MAAPAGRIAMSWGGDILFHNLACGLTALYATIASPTLCASVPTTTQNAGNKITLQAFRILQDNRNNMTNLSKHTNVHSVMNYVPSSTYLFMNLPVVFNHCAKL